MKNLTPILTLLSALLITACSGGNSSSSGSGGSTKPPLQCFASADEWKINHNAIHEADKPNPWSQKRQGWHDRHGDSVTDCYPNASPGICDGNNCPTHIRPD